MPDAEWTRIAAGAIIKMSSMPQKSSWPSWPQWKQLPRVLNLKERLALVALVLLTIGFAAAGLWTGYLGRTNAVPDIGGEYTEALVGEPQFINPLLAGINEADKDITALVYSGLFRYDAAGALVPDLAERYETSGDGKEYTFFLKKDVIWHDGKAFDADDVLFTFGALMNPDYASPLRTSWQGVNVEKKDAWTIRMTLENPRAQFLDKLTLGIMPRHIWGAINAKNIGLADANMKPIGTGPFRFAKYAKDKYGGIVSYTLDANPHFYRGMPYIGHITFFFFGYPEEALAAYKNGKVLGVSYIEAHNKQSAERSGARVHELRIPKYFSVFFNQNRSKALADQRVRTALALATDKKEIAAAIFQNTAIPVDSPILPWLIGYSQTAKTYPYSQDDAKTMLDVAEWKDKNQDGVREKIIGTDKEPTNLEFTLITSDFPELVTTGELLKKQWERVGVKVNLENYSVDELKQGVIKPRKYDALLFGEVLAQNPDPYIYWHSSQKKELGLNLALYDSKDADSALENARTATSTQEEERQLALFQDAIARDVPAIFLFSPNYLYAVDDRVRGIAVENIGAPSWRFADIEKWYLKTKRVDK